jgi:hypothetical protein
MSTALWASGGGESLATHLLPDSRSTASEAGRIRSTTSGRTRSAGVGSRWSRRRTFPCCGVPAAASKAVRGRAQRRAPSWAPTWNQGLWAHPQASPRPIRASAPRLAAPWRTLEARRELEGPQGLLQPPRASPRISLVSNAADFAAASSQRCRQLASVPQLGRGNHAPTPPCIWGFMSYIGANRPHGQQMCVRGRFHAR